MYTKNTEERRLKLFDFNMSYEYLSYVPKGRNSGYENRILNGYSDAYINLNETPIEIGGKTI